MARKLLFRFAMRSTCIALGVAGLASLLACVEADYSGTEFACDETAPACPDDMACIAGVCSLLDAPTDGTTGGQNNDDDDDEVNDGEEPDAPGDDEEDDEPERDTSQFADDFNRPDSPDVGNGWVERSADGFALADGAVAHATPGISFRDRTLYRPTDEDGSDFEASIDVVFSTVDPLGHPQIHLRVQRDELTRTGLLTGYVVYVDDDSSLVIDRLIAGEFTRESRINIDRPVVGDLYRLRARIVGTNPVRITATWEHNRDGGQSVRSTTTQDDSPERIATPGAIGLAAHTEANDFVYDNWSHARLDE